MTELAAIRSPRYVLAAILVAAIAMAVGAIVALAILLHRTETPVPTPAATALAPLPVSAQPARREPLMPPYEAPSPPLPAPSEEAAAAAATQGSAPRPAAASPPAQPEHCERCGVVTRITTYPGLSEVLVRFDDGEARVLRFRTRPPFHAGERVRLEDGLLVHE